ncbi:MAG: DUF927 domain-containing protein [Betaproteobacteria bacterium]|nr:DUF927 domain-containing protein [Betaproteobacteria bacterium]
MPDFIEVARARGLVIEHVNTDGRLQRVPVEGKPKTDKTGWYCYHGGGDRAYANFGRWDESPEFETWIDRSNEPLTVAEKKAIQETRQAIRKEAEAGYANAAESARRVFDSAAMNADHHSYLQKKGVKAFGVRADGDSLLIPLRDAEGVLWSLQRILPDGDKRFHQGGRVASCFHWLGDPSGASWLLLAEGYATAATIHEATGLPVAAAMNCGNLLSVAEALAAKYPSARFLVCADDDRGTQAKTGKNPGIDAARAVVKKLNAGQAKGAKRARYVAPAGLKEGATDFNDLATAAGIEAVRRQIDAAIKPSGKVLAGQLSPTKKTSGGGGGGDAPSGGERFTVDNDGVWYHEKDKLPFKVCSKLEITARTRDGDGQEWGYLLELPDYEGTVHQWAMPSRMLAGDGNEYRSNLLSMGLRLTPGTHAKAKLTEYLQTTHTDALVRCADVIGWHGRSFVLPDRSIGNGDEKVIFQSAASAPNPFKQKGSAAEWREAIGKYCVGNSRMVFAVSVSLAGALLNMAGLESGGFHLRGESSVGKTCALKVAASVFGGDDFLCRWRLTDNAMENVAAQHSDTVLVLDEIAMADAKTVGEIAYMLANETGKVRMSRTGAPRAALTWRLLFLSSGEKSLADHMGEVNKRSCAGQEVRVCDLPADASVGMGLFETLHDFADAEALHRWFMEKVREYHGAVGIAWLEKLVSDQDDLPKRIRELRCSFLDGLIPAGASGQVHRAANRFALVAAAGEIASSYGLTGWPEGEAIKAAKSCFAAWLDARGGVAPTEEMQMMAQARHHFEQGDNRYQWWHRTLEDRAPNVVGRCGFKRKFRNDKPYDKDDKESTATPDELTLKYYVLPESFITEVCKGFDHKAVCKLLRARGVLECSKDGFKVKERLPGLGNTRCYRINLTALFASNGDSEPLTTASDDIDGAAGDREPLAADDISGAPGDDVPF